MERSQTVPLAQPARAARPKRSSHGFRRAAVQLFVALLYNLDFQGVASQSVGKRPTKGVCAPGLHCYSCPGAVAACPIGSLQQAFASSSLGMGFYVVGTLLAFGALFGRLVCGWACPFGLLQDALDKAGRVLRLPKARKGTWSRRLSLFKFAMLALVVAGPLVTRVVGSAGKPLFCGYVCPAGTLPGVALVASHPMLQQTVGALFSWKAGILVVLVAAAFFVYRPFCRFLCPLGLLYGFFNRFCVLGYRVDAQACTGCGACVRACRMDVEGVGDRECIQCGSCVAVCAEQAIRFTVRPKRNGVGTRSAGRV